MKNLIGALALFCISQASLAETLSCDVVFKHELGTVKHKLSLIKKGNSIVRMVTFKDNPNKEPLISDCDLEVEANLNFETIICTSEKHSIVRTEKYLVFANNQVEGSATIDRRKALENGTIDKINKFTGVVNNSYETRPMNNIENCRLED